MKKMPFIFLILLCVFPFIVSAQSPADSGKWKENKKCTIENLPEIQTIQVGQNRAQLLKIFNYQGGMYNGPNRTFVYRKCPYIKVDIQFEASGTTKRYAEGRERLVIVDEDKIISISKPYLEFSIID